MSKQPEKASEPVVSEITLKLYTGAGLAVGELMNFERAAQSKGMTREELMVHLIREANAAAETTAA